MKNKEHDKHLIYTRFNRSNTSHPCVTGGVCRHLWKSKSTKTI